MYLNNAWVERKISKYGEKHSIGLKCRNYSDHIKLLRMFLKICAGLNNVGIISYATGRCQPLFCYVNFGFVIQKTKIYGFFKCFCTLRLTCHNI